MADIDHTIHAVAEIVAQAGHWAQDYVYSPVTNEFAHRAVDAEVARARIKAWFELEPPGDARAQSS